jgi:hypothetical protein
MPTYRTVISWLVRDFRGFAERYWAARRAQRIHLSEQIITIADEAVGADMAGPTWRSCGATPGNGRSPGWTAHAGGEYIARQDQVSDRATINIHLPQKGGYHPLIKGPAGEVLDGAETNAASCCRF